MHCGMRGPVLRPCPPLAKRCCRRACAELMAQGGIRRQSIVARGKSSSTHRKTNRQLFVWSAPYFSFHRRPVRLLSPTRGHETCDAFHSIHRLVGLVVRRPPRERKVPGSNPARAGIFSGSSHTSDLNIGTPVATLPGAWRYRLSAGTGRPSVSIP